MISDLLFILADVEIFGSDFFDKKDFIELLVRSAFNFLIVGYIVRYLYYPVTKNKDYLFTYLLISVTVFFLCFLLENVKLELGFALGLFAIFGIIRYRTDAIPIKEMTYLFIVIGISMINALSNKSVSIFEVLFTNGLITLITYLIDRLWFQTIEEKKSIVYEKIELIKPKNKQELIKDLKERTGLPIHEVKVDKIDFLRDTAAVTIYYNRD